jgi:PPK2 family polyphosphate:nucleotide phosphotransferase
MKLDDLLKRLIVKPGRKISLKNDFDPSWTADSLDKKSAGQLLTDGIEKLAEYQDKLYAQNRNALLCIFQAMDAAGKDGAIKHVMSGINPQGCQVVSFKQPSVEELDHDYLWRCVKALPELGRIGIFNRSYYEEVLVTRVHPEYLASRDIKVSKDLWKQRFKQINHFEKYLTENGTTVLKFFLHVSRKEQKKRFLERIDRDEKNWKFSASDVKERAHWKEYMDAYEDCFNHTSTKWAPWYVIPADAKWFTRLCVAGTIYHTLQKMNPTYPDVGKEHKQQLQEAKKILLAEKD